MLAEDEAVARLALLENLDRFFGEAKARHDIGHEAQAAAKNLFALFLAVGLVDQAQHRGGVGMVDEFMRQKGMQHHLDGRIWRLCIDEIWRARRRPNLRRRSIRTRAAGASDRAVERRNRPGPIEAMSEPVDLTRSTSTSSPNGSRIRSFSEVLPPPCRTSFGIAAEKARRVDAQRQLAQREFAAVCRCGPGVSPSRRRASASRSTHALFIVHSGCGVRRPHGGFQPPAKRRDHHPVRRPADRSRRPRCFR